MSAPFNNSLDFSKELKRLREENKKVKAKMQLYIDLECSIDSRIINMLRMLKEHDKHMSKPVEIPNLGIIGRAVLRKFPLPKGDK